MCLAVVSEGVGGRVLAHAPDLSPFVCTVRGGAGRLVVHVEIERNTTVSVRGLVAAQRRQSERRESVPIAVQRTEDTATCSTGCLKEGL